MKQTAISFCIAASMLSTVASAASHVHTANCDDAVEASGFSATILELKSRVLASSGPVSVDLMAFYQPSYAEKMGDQWVHTRIQTLVDNVNTALANSGIEAAIRLVNAQPITGVPDGLHYNTSDDGLVYGAGTIASARIQNPYENFPENTIYEAMGADLALYIRDYNADLQPENVLGYGTLGGELSTVFDTATLGSGNSLYPLADFVLAHELGHNFEAGHSVDDGGYTFLPAAHAYECGGRPTVMGPAHASGNRFYSSPAKFINGDVCGVEGLADNTSVIKEHIPYAAERRSAPETTGTVSFENSIYTIVPGDTKAVISLIREGDLSGVASVQVALFDGTAKEGRDFLTSFERVEFAAGESEALFNVPLSASASGKAKLALRYPYKLTIDGGDAELVLSESPAMIGDFTFSQSALTVAESAGKFTLTIARENGSDGEHAIRVYTENGTRTAGVDYQALDLTLVFSDGETSKSVDVVVLDNSILDDSGVFYVRLDAMGANTLVSEVAVSLVNNDQPPSAVDSGGSGGAIGSLSIIIGSLLYVVRRRKARV